ncbi:UNVERIFIED_CONTAM: RNA-binding component of cleavage and polyadenylation factor [Siphonaria sp. JEL0065]|nr:RNA-binding component of cleavage and polyadenylation factor [Siphonaria sp. JEL0065]
MVEVFTLADALGLTTTSLSANAQGVLNINVANGLGPEAAAAIVPFPAFDYEEHVRNVLSFDLDPQRKSGGEGVCRFFLKGFCAKGQACPYKHVSQATLNANAHKAGVVCKHYLRGPKCRNKHVRQAVCQNYVTGFCPKGPECPFGHPKFELPNLNDDGDKTGAQTGGQASTGAFNPNYKKEVMCYKCKQQGHIAINCPNEQAPNQGGPGGFGGFKKDFSQVKCYKCQGFGHFANQCPNGAAGGGMQNPTARFFRPPGGGGF